MLFVVGCAMNIVGAVVIFEGGLCIVGCVCIVANLEQYFSHLCDFPDCCTRMY